MTNNNITNTNTTNTTNNQRTFRIKQIDIMKWYLKKMIIQLKKTFGWVTCSANLLTRLVQVNSAEVMFNGWFVSFFSLGTAWLLKDVMQSICKKTLLEVEVDKITSELEMIESEKSNDTTEMFEKKEDGGIDDY